MSRPATTRLKVNPPLGSLPVLQYCAPDQLQVDPSYQRTLDSGPSQTLIRRIAMYWDWGLCQPLVVARRADGGMYVVDGQHRLEAAKLRGDIWQLPCVIASYRNAAEEAAAFVAINQERRPLGILQIFKASVAAGDTAALTIVAALKETGLSLASSTNLNTSPLGAMSNVSGLQACLSAHGEAVLRTSLAVLAKAYPRQIMRYGGSLFPGIVPIVVAEIKGGRLGVVDALAGFLRRREQSAWFKEFLAAIAGDPALGRKSASILVIGTAWRGVTGAPAPMPSAPMPKTPRAPVVAPINDAEKRWCEQCDKLVGEESARFCVSRFCSLRKRA